MTNYMNNNTKVKGFTLIELMITVAIVGILAAVAIPSYMDNIRKTRRADATNGLLECAATQERSYTLNNSYIAGGLAGCITQGDVHYNLTVTTTCERTINGVARFSCFTITATPKGNSSQADDDKCSSIFLDYTGARSAIDSDGNDSTNDCWKS